MDDVAVLGGKKTRPLVEMIIKLVKCQEFSSRWISNDILMPLNQFFRNKAAVLNKNPEILDGLM